MKRVLALFLALLCFFLASCSSGLAPVEGETPAETKDALNEKKTEAKTETKTEEKVFEDPKEDGEMNILLIGNSYSYYWCDELYGMLAAAGYENAKIYNVYYSGCKFYQHWEWLVNHENHYQLFCNDKNGRKGTSDVDLPYCLSRENWDVISFQQSGSYVYGEKGSEENLRNSVNEHLPLLYKYVNERFPLAKYYWLQSWVHEIGDGSKGLATLDQQIAITSWQRNVAKEVCSQYGFTRVPCGDAWEMIRHDPMIRENGYTLTARIQKGKQIDDLSHDGDIGGGQYLNACVWFEKLLDQSCVGNSFRPKYELDGRDLSLSEAKIALLQKTAHEAVLNMENK